ncbi:hypothetical protein MAMC_01374 [Methylacidimicrobium cyclopophantes]|uniref:Glycosyltransferase 61 catalytic domain-containing protein n=1 Tax=Methylacidimicrobium cyclopophantes TaxID=1041766 RepID=A0A5E6MLM0_9BACT|nr:glycosyltransferase family 61 protein [Methylacidimicrobium cyclopophantes]VVM06957.1 hypothetical protein MAMC_01374 [Methylacidimicrobium cyclopophantes]
MREPTSRRRLGIFLNRFAPWAVPVLEFVYLRVLRRTCLALFQAAWRAVPVSSEVLGPPKGVIVRIEDWLASDRRRGKMVHEASWTCGQEEKDRETNGECGKADGPLFVVEVEEGRVCTETGAILGRDDRLLAEITPSDTWFDSTEHDVLLRMRLPPVNVAGKRVAYICTHPALAHNYGHWLFECVSLYGYFREIYGWEQFDWIVINRLTHPFQEESLSRAGIPREKAVELNARLHLKAESLIASSYASYATNRTPKWVCSAVRRVIGPAETPRKPSRKIYLTRRYANRRKLANEKEVLRVLERYGVEEVVPERLSLSEQAALFAESKWVIGLYGAALCNVVFAPKGSVVLEFRVELVPNAAYYEDLARTCELQYEQIRATPLHRSRGRSSYYADVLLDARELEKKLDALPR